MSLSNKIINPAVNIETHCGKHNAMIEEEDLQQAIKEEKKLIILRENNVIGWDEFFIRRNEIFGERLI